MKVCSESLSKAEPDALRRQPGHIYRSIRGAQYLSHGKLYICVKSNHRSDYHLYSIVSGLCNFSDTGRHLDRSHWEDVTDQYVIQKGECS